MFPTSQQHAGVSTHGAIVGLAKIIRWSERPFEVFGRGVTGKNISRRFVKTFYDSIILGTEEENLDNQHR